MKIERKSKSTEDIIITVPKQYADNWIQWFEAMQQDKEEREYNNQHKENMVMWEFYWEALVEHRHDIMIPVLIVYLIIDKFVDRWFWINWFRKEFKA